MGTCCAFAQFVFLLYKIAMAATSVLLGSAARATECLLIMGGGTGALTPFHWL